CVFSRGEQMLQLQPLQLTIKHGEFIAAVGRIGSGKSSLLPAICGEMPLLSGSGCVYGSIGHVGQKPWTMNATFRDSVLFGNAYDEQKYSRTIAASPTGLKRLALLDVLVLANYWCWQIIDAGKSSITLALLRLIEPASGCITMDGIATSTVGLYDLSSRISMVPQDLMLLEGTIRDNLDPAYAYTDTEILSAIGKSCIGDLVFKSKPTSADASVPGYKKGTGLGTWAEAEADESKFSIGQRQLISLCRALLWKRTILVLDEATANNDSQSDKLMQWIIRKELKNCTVLPIAHRLKTVMVSCRILVMDQDKIAEFGTFSNPMARQGIFAEL
ncbi:ATP-binding cassette glutathione S-conjugate transporter ycf1, partial [Coemansia sp. RSA 1085]